MIFANIDSKLNTKGTLEIFPSFRVTRGSDLMVRGHAFYSIFNESSQLWSKDEFEVNRMIDESLMIKRNDILERSPAQPVYVKFMNEYGNGVYREYKRFVKDHPDNYHTLDQKVIFANTEVKKTDYASFKLPYPIDDGKIDAYDKLVSRLYSPEERQKFEWAIGSIIAGDSKSIQKFLVFYGEPASGKSTILGIIRMMFENPETKEGYCSVFDSRSLAKGGDFSMDFFEKDPLVAIQEDGDLSRIEDNTTLNSIISHEVMRVNVKYKTPYESRANCMLFMGTNTPVQITDIKSGLVRRLILVTPTNNPHPVDVYEKLMAEIPFELGHIAAHCLRVYKSLGRSYYNNYRATEMIEKTNPFYNFMLDNYYEFTNGITRDDAYALYKMYAEASNFKTVMAKYKFGDELKGYFKTYDRIKVTDSGTKYCWYDGLRYDKIGISDIEDLEKEVEKVKDNEEQKFIFLEQASRFDAIGRNYPAQEARSDGLPKHKWVNNTQTLKDIDTRKLHYVKVPENHIVIDFDIRDENGDKSLIKNLEAIQNWPLTYAEVSKSGAGIHLHYIYDGDPNELSAIYSENVEIKVYRGDASLRRQLSLCNDAEIAHISSGLPKKEVKEAVVKEKTIKNEERLRIFILRNLKKEYTGYTATSVSLIKDALDKCYEKGMHYDVSDMFWDIQEFASKSSNQRAKCLAMLNEMKLKSDEPEEDEPFEEEDPLVFFDIEVFPNFWCLCWKFEGEDQPVHKLPNPKPSELADLLHMKLVGYNNRNYDNHIFYAANMGYSNFGLYKLSTKLVSNEKKIQKMAQFNEAKNLSYTDVFDFLAAHHKKSLKKHEIELGIAHVENSHPWDQPLEEKYWEEVMEYCANDVRATERVFNEYKDDYISRVILAKIAGMTPNASTNTLTTKIIFEGNRNPQDTFNYPDISKEFPGYEFVNGHNMYRGIDVSMGGYVYANPGMYGPTWTFDVASMHPSSIIAMNLFGDYYTARFKALVDARLAIKHKDKEALAAIFDGAFMEFVDFDDEASLKALSTALKTAINSVYGLTSAKFPNAFLDPRNKNNIVALRGALFMVTLRDEVQKLGYTVVHIKTDSIKIENPDERIAQFIFEFGKKYGYNFEVEDKFEKLCLVDKAQIIEKLENGKWNAVGKEFLEPYVFKTLFSHEEIEFSDLVQVKSVTKGAIYLSFNEDPTVLDNSTFIGRVGGFVPVTSGGGYLCALREDAEKFVALSGSKGYLWQEAEVIKQMNDADLIDMTYFNQMVNETYATLGEFVNEKFPSVEDFIL